MKLTTTWYAFVPAMLGTYATLDMAAKAVIQAHRLSGPGVPRSYAAQCNRSYVSAVDCLRLSLDTSDSTLATAGLLSLYETIRKHEPNSLFTHGRGISAILRARPRAMHPTLLMRAALHGSTHATFQDPLISGTASPFDEPYWLDIEPAACLRALAPETSALRKLSNQLNIRLPALIACVRQLRQSAKAPMDLLLRTHELAKDILKLKNDAAETALLHRVAIRRTLDVYDEAFIPYSFAFESPYDTETLLIYWGTYLLALKLNLTLIELQKSSSSTADGSNESAASSVNTTSTVSPTQQALESEQERLVISILMCWQSGFGQVNPLSMVWSTLMHKATFRGQAIEPWRLWVWTRFNDSLAGWPVRYSMADMDQESEMLAGGPLTGWTVKHVD